MARKKPQAAPQVETQDQEKVRHIGQSNDATQDNSRKQFTIPRRYAIQLDGKKGLVVSGYSPEPIGGHYPHVSCHRILKDLGLKPHDYAQCDERHQEIITEATEAGLEVISVAEYQKRLKAK